MDRREKTIHLHHVVGLSTLAFTLIAIDEAVGYACLHNERGYLGIEP